MNSTRVVPPRKAVQQTRQDIAQIIDAYVRSGHWQSVASEFVTPWKGSGSNGAVGSRTNYVFLARAVHDHLAAGKPLRLTDIMEIVHALAQSGVLERHPQVQVVEVPVEAPEPSARELHNRQVRIDRAMNDRETSPIRGAKEKAKPLLKPTTNTNLAEAEASEKAARENAIVNEALSRINTFTGHTHGRTASGRAALREAFQMAMDQGLSAKEVLAAVETKASELAGNSSIR